MTNSLRSFIHPDGRVVVLRDLAPSTAGSFLLAYPDPRDSYLVTAADLTAAGFTETGGVTRLATKGGPGSTASPWDNEPAALEVEQVTYAELEAFEPNRLPLVLSALSLVMGAAALGAVTVLAIVVFGGAS
ncbi:hypothetical protein [Herbiconiux sp. VKM Ac-2851]|uniref:hypothetical protein n=1 Tax=Herbiconiux sp. VKM Ac-2851 TaxID=2739025 RepID=UPI0015659549|nr:hypothetical protein [Herbiconiux sp. VKM Ac-2851]NQX36274.1 hypothetical protein [Herbiconiux sp. VKM Ac-2851]